MAFKAATRSGAKLRMAITGPSGSGKTYSALKIATAFLGGKRFAVLDTENDSASLYADEFPFDVDTLSDFAPENYVRVIKQAVRDGYPLIVVDSLSHAWMGVGGILDQLDNAKGNFNKWKDLTPQQNELVDVIIRAPIHIVATMRSKQEYAVETGANGKPVPRKLGMAPVQRDGMEYEFGVVLDLDIDHVAVASKTRCKALDGKRFRKPGEDVALILREWLSGEPAKVATKAPAEQPRRAESREEREPERESVTGTDAAPPDDGQASGVADDRRDGAAMPKALAEFCSELEQSETPEECLVAFQRYRAELRSLSDHDQGIAWEDLCARTNEVGKMKNAHVWLKRAIAEHDIRAKAEAETPKESESTLDMARKAFAACRDARQLMSHAPNVLRLKGVELDAVALAYRDRWVEMAKALDGDARKRLVKAVGYFPAEIWDLCDWQPFRDLLGGKDETEEAQKAPDGMAMTDENSSLDY